MKPEEEEVPESSSSCLKTDNGRHQGIVFTTAQPSTQRCYTPASTLVHSVHHVVSNQLSLLLQGELLESQECVWLLLVSPALSVPQFCHRQVLNRHLKSKGNKRMSEGGRAPQAAQHGCRVGRNRVRKPRSGLNILSFLVMSEVHITSPASPLHLRNESTISALLNLIVQQIT